MKNSSTKNKITVFISLLTVLCLLPTFSFAQPATTAKTAAEWVWEDEGIYRKQLKTDGISDAVIEKLVVKRKERLFSGRKVVSLPADIRNRPQSGKFQNPSTQALCSDMGGETGWGGWTARSGIYTSCSPAFTGTIVPTAPRYNLTSGPGLDGCGNPGPPLPVVAPGFGNSSLQVGQLQTNGSIGGCGDGCIEEISYPLTVGQNDTNFTFAYAVVIENPSAHTNCEQPYVSLCIYDSNGNIVDPVCACFTYTAGPGLPGFYTSSCNVNSITYYKPWTLVGINLALYINQTLTVVVQNADCSLSGHYAHSYWDFSCGTLSSVYPYCIGEDSLVMVVPSTGTGGYTYSWTSIPPGFSSTNDTVIVNPQFYDTIILNTIPPSGCGFFSVFAIAPTIVNTALTYSIACNQVTFTDSTTIQGGTISGWNWQFPGGSPSSSTSPTPPVVTYPPGTYTASLTAVSQAGCTDTTAYTTFTILPPPAITANSVSICGNLTDTICASSGFSGYLWTPSGQITSCILVSTSSAPTYTVIGTDVNGCTAVATATVNTNVQPTITATSGQICSGGCVPLSAGGGVSYVWNSDPNLSCINCPNPTSCGETANTTYIVTGTDVNGCTNTATASVSILNNPTVNATPTMAGCTVANGTATAVGGGTTGPYSYIWSTSPAQSTQTATGLSSNTSYIVQVTDVFGCTSTTTVTIPVTSNPAVIANQPSTICFGQTTTVLTASSVPAAVSYLWSSPQGGLSCTTCSNPTVSPSATTTYVVIVTDVNGCTNSASVSVVVGAIPFLSAIASPTVCTGGTVILNANVSNVPPSQNPVSWNWYPPNSPPLSSDTVEDPTITPNTTTNLYVVVTDLYGCKDTAYATVYVQTIPSVSWTEWTPYITCEGYVIPLFANVSSNGGSAYWDFGDNSNFTDYQPAPGGMIWTSGPSPHIYNFGSTYSVSVVAINSICRDTIDTTFTINDMGQYLNVLPANVFTPNGDGINECFRPALDLQNVPNITNPDSLMATLVECITLEIWDRWGIKLFESSETEKCWDGKTKHGTPAKAGTYYYIAMFKDVVIKGFVELLR